jgi:hypothetical protein
MNDILRAVAPTLATLLGGPVAGLAVEAIGHAFGWSDATKEKVEQTLKSGNLTGEQIERLRIAEDQVKVRMRELDIDLERIAAQDRHSARERESKVGGVITPALAVLTVLAFLATSAGVLFGKVSVDGVLAGTILGYVFANAQTIYTYYFGSSAGSENKNAIISRMQAK